MTQQAYKNISTDLTGTKLSAFINHNESTICVAWGNENGDGAHKIEICDYNEYNEVEIDGAKFELKIAHDEDGIFLCIYEALEYKDGHVEPDTATGQDVFFTEIGERPELD